MTTQPNAENNGHEATPPERRLVSLKGPDGMTFSVAMTKGPDGKWSFKHPGIMGLAMPNSHPADPERGKPPSHG